MLVTLTAYADQDLPPEERKPSWEPGIAVVSGYTFAAQDASVSSTIGSTGAALRPDVDASDWHVAPYVGINVELMTPELPLVPGGVRLFVNGEYLPTFATKLDVAKEGVATELVPSNRQLPDPFPAGPCPTPIIGAGGRLQAPNCGCPFGTGCFPENAITGQGSRTTAEMRRDFFGAAVGIAVPFELSGRRLMIKPSLGWARFEFDIEGAVLRGIKPQFVSGGIPVNRDVPIFRLIDLRDGTRKAFNAIGPGLELEMEVHQVGPIETTLFVDAHGYRILGDRKVRLSDSATQRCNPAQFQLKVETDRPVAAFLCEQNAFFGAQPTDYSADWSYKINPWLYRVGLGLRFRWLGE